jgi:hypothetical protein
MQRRKFLKDASVILLLRYIFLDNENNFILHTMFHLGSFQIPGKLDLAKFMEEHFMFTFLLKNSGI